MEDRDEMSGLGTSPQADGDSGAPTEPKAPEPNAPEGDETESDK